MLELWFAAPWIRLMNLIDNFDKSVDARDKSTDSQVAYTWQFSRKMSTVVDVNLFAIFAFILLFVFHIAFAGKNSFWPNTCWHFCWLYPSNWTDPSRSTRRPSPRRPLTGPETPQQEAFRNLMAQMHQWQVVMERRHREMDAQRNNLDAMHRRLEERMLQIERQQQELERNQREFERGRERRDNAIEHGISRTRHWLLTICSTSDRVNTSIYPLIS